MKKQAAEFNPDELQDARFALRPAMERSAVDRVQSAYGNNYLPHYDTELDRVAPINGGSYVANEGDALEKHNFEICDDGQCRGFEESVIDYIDSYTP